MRHYFEWTIERGEDSFEIEIEGGYRHGSPATWTDPADPDEFEIEKVLLNGQPFELTEEEEQKITDWAYENPPDYNDYDYD